MFRPAPSVQPALPESGCASEREFVRDRATPYHDVLYSKTPIAGVSLPGTGQGQPPEVSDPEDDTGLGTVNGHAKSEHRDALSGPPPSSLAKIGQGGCRRCRQPQVPNKYCASTVVVHRIDQPGEGHRTYAGAAAAKMERCRLPAFSAPAGEPLLPATEGLPAESSFAHAASAGARSAATLCWRLASGICKSMSLFARHTNKPSGSIEGSTSDALLAVKAAHATVVFLSAPDCRSHLQHASQVPTAQPQSRRGLPSGRCVCVRSMPPGGSQCFCTQGAPIGLEDLLDMDAARLHALGSAQRYRTGDWGPLHCALPTFVQRHTICVWRTPPCLGLQAPLRVSISRWICAAANCLRSAALLARLNHSPLCPNPTALLRLPDPWMSGHAKTPYEPTSVKRHWA